MCGAFMRVTSMIVFFPSFLLIFFAREGAFLFNLVNDFMNHDVKRIEIIPNHNYLYKGKRIFYMRLNFPHLIYPMQAKDDSV